MISLYLAYLAAACADSCAVFLFENGRLLSVPSSHSCSKGTLFDGLLYSVNRWKDGRKGWCFVCV